MPMKRILIALAIIATVAVALFLLTRPSPEPPPPDRLDAERVFADLEWLAATEREGRMAGSAGGLAAREWLIERFTEIGLEIELHAFSFETREGETIDDAANILGLLRGTLDPGPVIAVTAHYDGLGMRDGDIFHGADDNASGVAAMLGIARHFQAHRPRHSLLFIAFDAEEHGKKGAYALFEDGILDDLPVVFNVNLDMVSRDVRGTLYAVGTTHYEWLHGLLDQLDLLARVTVARDPAKDAEWTSASDHAAFHDNGIPFIYFGVDDHPDYHRPTDTADRVDRDFYRRAAETILDFLLIADEHLP